MENILEHRRILRIEGSAEDSRCTCVDRPSRSHHEQFRTQGSAHRAAVQRCVVSMTFPLLDRPLRSLEQFRTQGFLHIKSTAVQRCARKSTEFASGSNIVGESLGEMKKSLVTQDSTHGGFC